MSQTHGFTIIHNSVIHKVFTATKQFSNSQRKEHKQSNNSQTLTHSDTHQSPPHGITNPHCHTQITETSTQAVKHKQPTHTHSRLTASVAHHTQQTHTHSSQSYLQPATTRSNRCRERPQPKPKLIREDRDPIHRSAETKRQIHALNPPLHHNSVRLKIHPASCLRSTRVSTIGIHGSLLLSVDIRPPHPFTVTPHGSRIQPPVSKGLCLSDSLHSLFGIWKFGLWNWNLKA